MTLISRSAATASMLGVTLAVLASFAGTTSSTAQNAYIAHRFDGTVSVLDTTTNTVVATIPGFSGPSGVAATLDGSKVYVGNEGGNTVSVIDTSSNTITATIPLTGPYRMAVSPDGTKLYVSYSSHDSVYVIDTSSNTVTGSISLGAPQGTCIVASPDGSKLYVVVQGSPFGKADYLAVVATASNTVIQQIPVGALPVCMALSPDGSKAYVVNNGSGNVSVIDTASSSVIATVSVGFEPINAVVSLDGGKVYVTNGGAGDNTVSVINAATNKVSGTVPVGPQPTDLDITTDGSKVYVENSGSNNGSDTLSVIDTSSDTASVVAAGNYPYSTGKFISPAMPKASVEQPINSDGSSVFKASRGVIPVIFNLAVNGVATCTLPNATIALTRISGGTDGPVDEKVYQMQADDGQNFRVSNCQYIYNLGSKSLGAGTYEVQIFIANVAVGTAVFGLQ